jgi:hypothetical protein
MTLESRSPSAASCHLWRAATLYLGVIRTQMLVILQLHGTTTSFLLKKGGASMPSRAPPPSTPGTPRSKPYTLAGARVPQGGAPPLERRYSTSQHTLQTCRARAMRSRCHTCSWCVRTSHTSKDQGSRRLQLARDRFRASGWWMRCLFSTQQEGDGRITELTLRECVLHVFLPRRGGATPEV